MKTNLLKFKSIKDKVFYFSFLVTLSIILLLIFISYFISYNSIKNNSISRELDTLEIIGNQAELVLNSAQLSSTGIIIDSDVQNTLTNSSINNIQPSKADVLKIQRAIDNSMYKDSVISGTYSTLQPTLHLKQIVSLLVCLITIWNLINGMVQFQIQ